MNRDIKTNIAFWNTIKGCAVALTVLLVLFSVVQIKQLFWPSPIQTQTTPNTISVEGTGEAMAIPDVATFSFSVTENGATVAAAQTTATTKTNAAIKAMKDAGVADADIQTTSYNINPHYDYGTGICTTNGYCPQRSTLNGYDVSETIQIKVRDVSKAGALLQSVGSLGVQNVDSLQFSVDKPDAVADQARAKAIANARSKADQLANELGVHIVRVTNFVENSGGGILPMMYSAKAMDTSGQAAPAPTIATGQQKITSNVVVTYEIR